MKKILSGLFLLCFMVYGLVLAHAQTTNVPTSIADAGVSDAQVQMDKDTAIISSANTQMQTAQADLTARQQAIEALASENPPLNSALNLCNSNPNEYCPNWNGTTNSGS